jgi:HEAT repeat protein
MRDASYSVEKMSWRTVKPQLTAKSATTRRRAVEYALKLGSRAAIPFLLALTHDLNRNVRFAAVHAIGFLGGAKETERLVEVMIDREEAPLVRGAAAEALGNIGRTSAVRPLVKALSSECTAVRYWAAYSLGELRALSALPALVNTASRERASLRGWGSVRSQIRTVIDDLRARGK